MNREIEIQTIAHLIDEPKNYMVNSVRLSEDLFTEGDMREVFVSYVKRIKEGRTPDAINLSATDESRLTLLKIISEINYDVSFSGWLSMLTDKWKERKLNGILTKASLVKGEIDDVIKVMQSELASLSQVNVVEPKIIKDHILDVFKVIDENRTQVGLTGVDTGLYMLNLFTSGWQGGDLVIVAGDTSQGKTSLALQFARTAGLKKVPVGVYSYEMSCRQLTARLMSQETEISSKRMLTGKIELEAIGGLTHKLHHLIGAPIFIDECSSTRLDYLLNSMTALHLTKGIRLFVIDYLQLLSNAIKGGTKEQEVAGIARELKNFAKRTNTTVILLSQLNRGQNKRGGSEPKISDLRDSGQIEEAADIVILCYRPEVYGVPTFEDGLSTEGKAELIFAKGRNIGLARFIMNFNKELTLFSNYNDDNRTN